MKKPVEIFKNIITSGFPQSTNNDIIRRVRLANFSAFIALIFIIFFLIFNYMTHTRSSTFFLLSICSSFFLNFFILRWKKSIRLSSIIFCVNCFILFQYLLLFTEPYRIPFVWSFILPMISAFLLGMRGGLIFTLGFWIFSAMVLIIPVDFLNFNKYPPVFIARYLSSFLIISVVPFYYEYIRMKAEKELRFNERRYSMILSKGPSVYTIVNKEGDVVYESPSLSEVYGYKPDELKGSNVFGRVHPDDIEKSEEAFKRLFEKPDKSFSTELRYRHKDGTWLDIEVTGLNLLNDPAINGILLTSHNISGLKNAEREIRALNENLENRIAKRTEELRKSEDLLRQSEKMKAIGQLAGGIAHDFNNQLAGIMGCADLIRNQVDKEDILYDYADTIVNTAKKASDLTGQLLAFARKGKYYTKRINIHNIIDEVIALLERTIDKRIIIKRDFKARTPFFTGDPAQFHNVLLNLAINARDAMPSGGELTFSTGNEILDSEFCSKDSFDIEPGEFICIDIKDNGTGIDGGILPKIFEPFFTTKNVGMGIGMGLAVVYGAVESHKGSIKVESKVGRGSLFRLLIPVSSSGFEDDVINKISKREFKGGAHILVVDDEETVLKITSAILEKIGHKASIFNNGYDAIEFFQREWMQVDLVILDMVLPEIGGADLFKKMQEINPKARIILSSGYSINKEIEHLLGNGAAAFIQKPFFIEDFIRVLDKELPVQKD